jgi:hypothetical protein
LVVGSEGPAVVKSQKDIFGGSMGQPVSK